MIKLTLENYVAELNGVDWAPMGFLLTEDDYELALWIYAGPAEYVGDMCNATKLLYCLLILEAEGR